MNFDQGLMIGFVLGMWFVYGKGFLYYYLKKRRTKRRSYNATNASAIYTTIGG